MAAKNEMTKVSEVQGLESWMLLENVCLPTVLVCPGQVDSVRSLAKSIVWKIFELLSIPDLQDYCLSQILNVNFRSD